MFRIKIEKELNFAIFVSFVLHLFCFIGVEFNFNSVASRHEFPKVYFLGEFLDKIDFLASSAPNIMQAQGGISSGHDKDKEILYKSNPAALNRKIDLFKKDRHFFKKISRIEPVLQAGRDRMSGTDVLSMSELLQRSRLFIRIDSLNNPDDTENILNEVNFIDAHKPTLIYEAPEAKNIAIFSLDRQKSENLKRGVFVFRQKLSDMFFYKKLPASVVEAELEILSKGNILSVKKILSSGDLEVDLFVLKLIRRKLYSENKRRTLHLKRIRISIGND